MWLNNFSLYLRRGRGILFCYCHRSGTRAEWWSNKECKRCFSFSWQQHQRDPLQVVSLQSWVPTFGGGVWGCYGRGDPILDRKASSRLSRIPDFSVMLRRWSTQSRLFLIHLHQMPSPWDRCDMGYKFQDSLKSKFRWMFFFLLCTWLCIRLM
mgnify:CR=1 FL=1